VKELPQTLKPTDIKYSNKLNVLQYMRLRKLVTKPEIAKEFDLSAPTASKLVDELVADGYAKMKGRGMSTDQGGKRPKLFAFNPMGGAIVSLHIGVRKIDAALINLEAEVLYRLTETIAPGDDTDKLLKKINACVEEILQMSEKDRPKVLAIGMGCPGVVDFGARKIVTAYGVQKLEKVELGSMLERNFGLPVWIDNECNNLALAEQWFGEGETSGTMINLMIEEGIGAGIIIENQMIRGESYSFGEVGHMVIDMEGLPCTCGNRGCWEQYVSIDALLAQVSEVFRQTSYLRAHAKSPEDITIPLIAQALRHGDEAVKTVVGRLTRHLAVGISSLVNIFNPNQIILHGSLQPLGDAIVDELRELVRGMALPAPAQRVVIRFSSMGKDAHLIGAATLGIKGVFESPEILFGEVL